MEQRIQMILSLLDGLTYQDALQIVTVGAGTLLLAAAKQDPALARHLRDSVIGTLEAGTTSLDSPAPRRKVGFTV